MFDGRTITITYSIESEKDLGEKPFPFEVRKLWALMAEEVVQTLQKLEGKYVGMTTMSGHGSERLDVANVWWDIEAIELDYEGNVIKETGISHLV